MRWHWLPLGVLAVGFAGWLAFEPEGDGGDLVVARDRLLADRPVVAMFSPGGAEGYRFTALPGEGWVWERTAGPGGVVRSDALVWNGREHLLRIADGCFIPVAGVREPLIPGWNAAPRLVAQAALRRVGDTRAEYTVDAAPFLVSGQRSPVLVTEVLAQVRAGRLTAHTTAGEDVTLAWTGSYEIRPAGEAETAEARSLITAASPSEFSEITFVERVTGTLVLSTALLGPYTIVISEDCPDSPVLLGSAVRGGQMEGLRTAPSPLRFTNDSPPQVQSAIRTRLRIRAPVESFNAEMAAATFGTVPITESGVLLVSTGTGSGVAVQVLSCTATPWFAC